MEDEMITDRYIVSRRAQTRGKAVGRRAVRGILTTAMAALLTLPSLAAWGLDGPRKTPRSANVFEAMALPPIPYLDSMPWLKWNAGVTASKIEDLAPPLPDRSGIAFEHDRVVDQPPVAARDGRI